MHILRAWCSGQLPTRRLRVLQELQSLRDCHVPWVQLCSAGICIDGVSDLVVAALIETAEIEPDFRDIWVNADCTRVGIKSVPELVDLEIEHAD